MTAVRDGNRGQWQVVHQIADTHFIVPVADIRTRTITSDRDPATTACNHRSQVDVGDRRVSLRVDHAYALPAMIDVHTCSVRAYVDAVAGSLRKADSSEIDLLEHFLTGGVDYCHRVGRRFIGDVDLATIRRKHHHVGLPIRGITEKLTPIGNRLDDLMVGCRTGVEVDDVDRTCPATDVGPWGIWRAGGRYGDGPRAPCARK